MSEARFKDVGSNARAESLRVADIEHMPVTDDPRVWTSIRKSVVLWLIASASMIAGLATNIQNPAIENMEQDLPATASQISLSISLFIAIQGFCPLLWTALSEIKGRKVVYVTSIAIFTGGSIAVALSKTITLVIVFRVVQAVGSSAVMSIGAATLADIFDPVERGTKLGVQQCILSCSFSWAISRTDNGWGSHNTVQLACTLLVSRNCLRNKLHLHPLVFPRHVPKGTQLDVPNEPITTTTTPVGKEADLENQQLTVAEASATLPMIKLTFRDVNPIQPLWIVMRRPNNLVILLASGLMFAFNFVVVYSASRALESSYGYNALQTGFILLSFGIGSLAGSLVGGRYSDTILARLKTNNGGVGQPEMRLQSTTIGLICLPPSALAFGWVTSKHIHVAAICVFLFLLDANNGRSSTVVAANSCFRGISAFVATEVAVPLQESVGDGWQYTIWAGLLTLVGLLIWMVASKGGKWRETAELRENCSDGAAIKIVRPEAVAEQSSLPPSSKVASQKGNSLIELTSRQLMKTKVVPITTHRRVFLVLPLSILTHSTIQAPDALSIPRVTSPAITTSASPPVISTPPPTLAANAINAPVFVPKFPTRLHTQSPAPASSPPPQSPYPSEMTFDDYTDYPPQVDETSNGYYHDPNAYDSYPPGQEDYYMNMTMPVGPVFIRQPLNYHLYSTPVPPSFLANSTDTHFLSPSHELRTLLQTRSEDLHMAATPGLGLPEEMQGYHSIIPLDNLSLDRRKFGNWNSTVYRAVNSKDGATYCLRRIENFRMTNQSAFTAIETWSKLRHPGIVAVQEAFTTHAFGDSSLVVAYAYYPKARTLLETHLKPGSSHAHHGRYQPPTNLSLPERTLWSYIVQLATAIKYVHDAGQALRMIDASKILVTGKHRLRVSSCGIVDVLLHDSSQPHTHSHSHPIAQQDMHSLQQEDLTMFGRLIFALCSGQVLGWSGGNFQKTIEMMGRVYSPEVKAVAFLLTLTIAQNINQVMDIISTRVADEMADALTATDVLENELMTELENARLVRLLCKLGFINERPEFARDDRWSETGDRYIVKLFRDHVFHQVDESGNPNVNLGHVLACLNKLDVGTDEKLMLTARDEQSCLVVNYRQIKGCVQSAFDELARPSGNGGYR
ncbi:PAN2-PAN3 deadenylation complex subunit PAN3 [Mycena indigotica]|uniref:PAN2-PAN3 deadenylation complex subunit PAN3 n=1 Tax=Mycena indigotica TaxID=2126181 RepID=A0A8H6SE55_9AGAR|nr:PAN2-PAN3 deadenylation complex subunit PAN3 [Mycena indigotica]KAF7297105.1 PAN2-PAN3 deadenylation complex subunit PAN3 [Mycena indigotica]